MFQGFSQEAVDFLWGIRFNNERGWFEARKEEYLTLVAGPMRELGEQVHAAVEEEFPKLGLNLHVSRIYRDARRLHGAAPIRTTCGSLCGGQRRSGSASRRSILSWPRSITAWGWAGTTPRP